MSGVYFSCLRETDRISMNIMTCVCVLELYRRVPKDSLLYVELECNNALQNMYKSKSILFVKSYRILFTKLTKNSEYLFLLTAAAILKMTSFFRHSDYKVNSSSMDKS